MTDNNINSNSNSNSNSPTIISKKILTVHIPPISPQSPLDNPPPPSPNCVHVSPFYNFAAAIPKLDLPTPLIQRKVCSECSNLVDNVINGVCFMCFYYLSYCNKCGKLTEDINNGKCRWCYFLDIAEARPLEVFKELQINDDIFQGYSLTENKNESYSMYCRDCGGPGEFEPLYPGQTSSVCERCINIRLNKEKEKEINNQDQKKEVEADMKFSGKTLAGAVKENRERRKRRQQCC